MTGWARTSTSSRADGSGRAAVAVADEPAAPRFTADRDGAAHPLHGVFVPTAPHAPVRTIELTTSDDELVVAAPADVAHELAHLSAADDPFATPPPPAGTRRTVQIKGRPAESRMPSMAQRHRGRTASDRVGARPDRIALWAVALGAILILLAAMTSSSQAAVAHHAATAPAATAHVVHVAGARCPRRCATSHALRPHRLRGARDLPRGPGADGLRRPCASRHIGAQFPTGVTTRIL